MQYKQPCPTSHQRYIKCQSQSNKDLKMFSLTVPEWIAMTRVYYMRYGQSIIKLAMDLPDNI